MRDRSKPKNSRRLMPMVEAPDAERSRVMRLVKSAGNVSTEKRLISIMRKHKIGGWRRKQSLPGHPDFVFPMHRTVVFVDGCFWHGCVKCYRKPTRNAEYWLSKVQRNMARDRRTSALLRRSGWKVVRIWEHALKDEARVAQRIATALDGPNRSEGSRFIKGLSKPMATHQP